MNKGKIIGIVLLTGVLGLTVFHIVHYALFCRYRGVPDKSHCSVCRHARVCSKTHKADVR
jgi:hypothetical protein